MAVQAPTAVELERYLALQQERTELTRKADALDKEQKQIGEKIREWMKSKDTRACKRLNFNIAIADYRKFPKWKDAFIAVAGSEAAAKVESDTEPSTVLQITKL